MVQEIASIKFINNIILNTVPEAGSSPEAASLSPEYTQ